VDGETFGERIRRLRKRLGKRSDSRLSQEGLAALVGRDRSAVARWEGKNGDPDAKALVALARVFGTTVERLVEGCEGWGPDLTLDPTWSPDDIQESPGFALLAEMEGDQAVAELGPREWLDELYSRALQRGLTVEQFPILDNRRNAILRNERAR